MKNKIRYTCSGYRYAPESFKCYMVVINVDGYNHSYYELKNFTSNEREKVAMTYISKGKKEAEAVIKKIVRSKREYYNNITYGYKLLDENSFTYLQYLKVDNNTDIQSKLKLYKEVKEYYKSKNYIITDIILDSCNLDGNYLPINPERKVAKKELNTKPIKIWFLKKK